MKRCHNCNHENAQANMYCERCGTPLSAPVTEQTYASMHEAYTTPGERSVTTQDQSYYNPPPPPPVQSIYQVPVDGPPPPPSTFYNPALTPNYGFSNRDASQERRRSLGATLFSALLYLVGAFCFVFGIAGFMLYGTSTTLVGFVFIVLSIVALIVLIPLLIARKHLVLKWWIRLLIVVGLTIAAIIALFGIAAMNSAGSNFTAFGVVFIIYGFATAIVAFW